MYHSITFVDKDATEFFVTPTYRFAYTPTNENYPANEWTTDILKMAHVGEVFCDSTNGRRYIWRNTSYIGGYAWEESERQRNTWDDWHLISPVRPAFAQPEPKTKYVEIPGASSKLDFSKALTGYPLYENRTGSFEFTILNDLDGYSRKWVDIYSQIANAINGRQMRAILEDDPDYFYEGEFSVEEYTPGSSQDEPRSVITITYDVGPYKWYMDSSIGSDWLWDPFNFETGIIYAGVFGSIDATTSWKTLRLLSKFTGYAPLCPRFIVSTTNGSGMDIRLVNPNLNIDETHHVTDGSWTLYDFIIYGDDCELYFRTTSGTGKISVEFRQGRL